MENKDIWDKLNNHEQRITSSEKDINDIKVDTATQQVTVKNLNTSMKQLNETIEKLSDKLENFMIGSENKGTDNWKYIISVILIPVIFYLLTIIK
ncbi:MULTISPECIES: heavy-metal-associated domain-containing protein [Clostridium]|uniref:heavy-metal-associated domain-containing protein n=1 Tax=Clostridium TaxID=1485 RepID=UPI0008268F82|nr:MULTISPECIES: heavy metal-associated domain-containing protein [Clostridium]PJI07655.1 hypothetical protein CUB90_07165 [Clostridium sp. CT7]